MTSRTDGKVERSHRVDEEKFWGRDTGQAFDAATEALAAWDALGRYDPSYTVLELAPPTP